MSILPSRPIFNTPEAEHIAAPKPIKAIGVMLLNTLLKRDISNISTPEPRQIVINPFDPSSLPLIEKSIVAANIGITPMNDGRLIRVPIPELSEERRKDMVKIASRTTEDQRVTVRNIRRDANDQIKNLEKQNELTEDDRKQSLDEIQKITNEIISKMDNLLTSKEKEIMEV